jgi:dTDP-glucose 4,6-dehydratase/UDP-glucose 4-epimerase|tara:strand:- start:1096 stop:1974 length:879 start_codon:yes stop_codon:yes gene_type:complete
MAKKVLVTGASGMIGRELCKQLDANGYYVVAIDNHFRYSHKPTCIEFVTANIQTYLSKIDNDFDYIFHMGAINGTKYFYDIPNQLLENNITTDFAVFNFCKQNNKCKLIYASSSEVVAGTEMFPTPELIDVDIKDIHNPRWSYRLSKMVSENYLINCKSIDFLIVRFFNAFSPASGSGHFVRDILDKIDNEDFTLIGADETRSFIRVEDTVDALLNIFKDVSFEVINIGSDEEITVLEAATLLAKHKGINPFWKHVDGNLGSVKRRRPDISKLKGYYPAFNPAKFLDSVGDL